MLTCGNESVKSRAFDADRMLPRAVGPSATIENSRAGTVQKCRLNSLSASCKMGG